MRLEFWFGIGALVMTVLAGFVLVPTLKRALRDDREDRSQRGE